MGTTDDAKNKAEELKGRGKEDQLRKVTRAPELIDAVARSAVAGGAPVAAYADGAYLTEDGLVLPVRVGGQLAVDQRQALADLQHGGGVGDVDDGVLLRWLLGRRRRWLGNHRSRQRLLFVYR